MSGTILVAEDDRVLAEIIRFNFDRAGYDVVPAYDGNQAAGLAAGRPFDLIVSDYQMPKLNGEDFARAVREGEANANTPIFLCTAKGYEIDEDRLSRELRIARFFLKPFSPRELVEAAAVALEHAVAVG
jgi:DNA-binding response OmpR family regulator